jgi:hypothetical protein
MRIALQVTGSENFCLDHAEKQQIAIDRKIGELGVSSKLDEDK